MADSNYEAWDAPFSPAPLPKQPAAGAEYEAFEPPSGKAKQGIGETALKTAGIAGAAGLGTWGLGRILKWAFPGFTQPTKRALSEIDSALKQDFGGKGLKEHFADYTKLVRDSGQPVTFADYIANSGVRAPNTAKVLNTMLDQGGKPAVIAEQLTQRGEGKRSRVMESLAKELGIPETSLNQTLEELKAARGTAAKGLYGAAFSNKEPIRDTRLLELFEKHAPVMEGALENAKEAFKYDPSKQVELQTRAALEGPRKDAWKFPIKAEDVPDYLHIGEPKGGLQTYISPNIETLDRMKRALWQLEQKRVKEGAGDVGAIRDARKELTAMLDEIGPPEYKQARQKYAGDVALEEAADVGANVFKQNPADFRKTLLAMSPDERQALSRGFYGSLMNMNDPRFTREVISGSPAYQKQRELLSAVFPNTQGLHNFLKSLEAEQAMLTGEKAFVAPGAASQSVNPLVDHFRAIASATAGQPRATMFGSVHFPPYDPTRAVPRRGSSVLFSEPTQSPLGMEHPEGRDIYTYLRGWPWNAPIGEVVLPGLAAASAGGARLYNQMGDEERPIGGLGSISGVTP